MIGLLDPALFLPRSNNEVQQEFDMVLRACKQHGINLPQLDEYWQDLWASLGQSLERSVSPEAKRAIQEVRKLSERSTALKPLLQTPGHVWRRGFLQLFGTSLFANSWEDRMAAAMIRALATEDDVVLLTRRVLGRNLEQHNAGNSLLEENTRWLLHLQPAGMGHKQVLCIYHHRNLTERWTSRFDWRLPGAQNGERYPFCPCDDWWKGSTQVWGTVLSKHAWLDKHGNGWARPNIPNGAGYHWDVFIRHPALQQAVGLDQINVVEFSAPSSEGIPGQIHHVPTDKAGKITRTGWHC